MTSTRNQRRLTASTVKQTAPITRLRYHWTTRLLTSTNRLSSHLANTSTATHSPDCTRRVTAPPAATKSAFGPRAGKSSARKLGARGAKGRWVRRRGGCDRGTTDSTRATNAGCWRAPKGGTSIAGRTSTHKRHSITVTLSVRG